MNAIDIARYLVQKNADLNKPITNLKLQKILYYVQGYSYKNLNEEAFHDPIYKWPYGPVIPTVYFAYNSNRAHDIYQIDDETADPVRAIRAFDCIKKLVDQVDEACENKTANQLVSMTHSETPWEKAVDSKEISKDSIRLFFERHDPLGISTQED